MEQDARAKASEAIDRRTRQRQAAAAALLEITPEAVAAEEARQAVLPPGNGQNTLGKSWESFATAPNEHEATLSARLAEAVRPVLDEDAAPEGDVPEVIGLGRAVIQWALTAVDEDALDNNGGYELALQVQVDEQPPAGVVLEISDEMLAQWQKGEGLQGNRVQHKKFAAGIIEKAVELAAEETGNHLIFALETLLREPTRTVVGDDEEA